MSISSRSTKAAMYSEIERLRSLCDLREQQHRATCAELSAEKAAHADTYAQLDELRAQPPAPQPSAAPLSEREECRALSASRTRNELMKRLAITCKASVKWVDGQGFKQYKDGNWVAVPTHTIEFVSKGLTA